MNAAEALDHFEKVCQDMCMGTSWGEVVEGVAERCAPFGLDLVQPSSLDEREGLDGLRERLPDLGRPSSLAILIGNTRAIWPHFLKWLAQDTLRLNLLDPFDRFVETAVVEALRKVPYPWRVRWGHEPPPRAVPMQRVAEAFGLADLSPSKMCIHETFGPWIALRAVVVVDVDGSTVPPRGAKGACAACDKPCVPLFDKALSVGSEIEAADDRCKAWVAVRSACPLGRDHAYDQDQMLYHYTKDPGILEDSLRRLAL